MKNAARGLGTLTKILYVAFIFIYKFDWW